MVLLILLTVVVILVTAMIGVFANFVRGKCKNIFAKIAVFITSFLATFGVLVLVELPMVCFIIALVCSIVLEQLYYYYRTLKANGVDSVQPDTEPAAAV